MLVKDQEGVDWREEGISQSRSEGVSQREEKREESEF